MTEANYMDNLNETIKFKNSPRGQFIIAQALYLGVKKLQEVEGVHREVSNILDMQYLLDVLHPGMKEVFKAIEDESNVGNLR